MQSSPTLSQPPGSSQKAPQIIPDNGLGNVNSNAGSSHMNGMSNNNNNIMPWMYNQGLTPPISSGDVTATNTTGTTCGGSGSGPNDLNSVMNSMLLNNALQQQQQQQQVQQQQQQQQSQPQNTMMNPFVLQTMLNQGMIPNAFGTNAMGQMGMNNLFQQGMMNPAMAGMMSGLMNSTSGSGGISNTAIGGGGASSSTNFSQSGGGSNTNPESSGASLGGTNTMGGMDGSNMNYNNFNNNDLLLQMMSNPLTAHMIAQGLNPMMLLGSAAATGGMGMGGMAGGMMGMGQNQYLNPNSSLGPLGFGMNNMGGGFPSSRSMDVAAAGMPRVGAMGRMSMNEDGLLKQTTSSKVGEKLGKKLKVKGKPKRPLSAYNFFFRDERARILDNLPRGKTTKDVNKVGGEEEDVLEKDEAFEGKSRTSRRGKKAKETEDIPNQDSFKVEKDEDEDDSDPLPLGVKDYDQVGADGKKIPHGKIGFESLAKQIGKQWQSISAEEMEKYKVLADEDMARYKREMEIFLSKEVAKSDESSSSMALTSGAAAMPSHPAAMMFGLMNQTSQQVPLTLMKKTKSKRKEGGEVKQRKTKGIKKEPDNEV